MENELQPYPTLNDNQVMKKAAGRGLHALRRSPEGRCLRIFRLVVKNPQARISYNMTRVHGIATDCQEQIVAAGKGRPAERETP